MNVNVITLHFLTFLNYANIDPFWQEAYRNQFTVIPQRQNVSMLRHIPILPQPSGDLFNVSTSLPPPPPPPPPSPPPPPTPHLVSFQTQTHDQQLQLEHQEQRHVEDGCREEKRERYRQKSKNNCQQEIPSDFSLLKFFALM